MKLNIIKKSDLNIKGNEVNIIIESNSNNDINDLINHINNYNNTNNTIIGRRDYESTIINYKDIVLFYSEGKSNYCKTVSNEIYTIKRKLFELENLSGFVRIAKCYIVNIEYVKSFNLGQTGNIMIRMYDGTELKVSRRRIKNVLNCLEGNNT